MVYQVIKRDPNLMGTAIFMGLALAACPIIAATSSPEVLIFVGWMASMGTMFTWCSRRASLFEAGLPIAGRQLFLARVASVIPAIWLSVTVAAASALLLAGPSNGPVVWTLAEVGSLTTLAAMCLHAFRPDRIKIPGWLCFLPMWLLSIGLPALAYDDHRLPPFGVAGAKLLIAGCFVLSAAVFSWVWSRVPNSYQLESARALQRPGAVTAATPARVRRRRFDWVWLPVWRSVFAWHAVFFWFMLFVSGANPGGITGSGWLVFLWPMFRIKTVWLRGLPVKPRVALLAFAGPCLIALTAGYLFWGLRWVDEPHSRVLMLAVILGWALTVLLAMALYDWRALSRVPRGVRATALAVIVVAAVMSWLPMSIAGLGKSEMQAALARAGQVLPASLPLFVLACAVPLLFLAWALDRVWANAEYFTIPRLPKENMWQ